MTHEVTNQPPPISGGNAWRGDPLLIQIAEDFSAPVRKDLDNIGRFVLTPEAQSVIAQASDYAKAGNATRARFHTPPLPSQSP